MASSFDLDHVAVALERQDDAWPRYAGDLGGTWVSGGATPGFFAGQVRYRNGMKVEVLEPFRPDLNDFLRRFLDHRGPGPHHLTFKVPDLAAALDDVEAAGYRPVGVDLRDPMWKEAFIHPKDGPGVVVQLAQAAGEWSSPPPEHFPAARREAATLLRVTHAVTDLDDGLRLFAALLQGETVAKGDDNGDPWIELAWPGPGRLRLVTPGSPASPLTSWIGDGAGRLHHIAFAVDEPATVSDVTALEGGMWEIDPAANAGVRLILSANG